MQTISGGASYDDLPGNLMANGKMFDPSAMTAAMLQTKLGTAVTVSLVTPAAITKLCGSTTPAFAA
jgi:hypothetical protein